MGATGRGWRLSVVRTDVNCGVLSPGSWTIVTRTALFSCMSSQRSESVKPRIANFAPQ